MSIAELGTPGFSSSIGITKSCRKYII